MCPSATAKRYGILIDKLLSDEATAGNVSRYLNPRSTYAAMSFDSVGSRNDYAVTNDDVLAVSFLDAPIRAAVFRQLMDSLASEISRLLNGLSPEVFLWEVAKPMRPTGQLTNYGTC